MLLTLWVFGGIILVMALGFPPVTRTQEARVLETSRQMLGTGWRGWLLPTLNGEPRLKKPPLSYWMTASLYKLAGVSEFAGRFPNAIIGWLTLSVTFLIARQYFGAGAAIVSAASLLGSYLFFRYTRLAETDAPATLFVTIAISAFWKSAIHPRARWHHIAAAAMGLAILSKGAPVIFAIVFLLTFCWLERRWDVAMRFLKVGAPITLLIVAAPWYLYVSATQGWSVFLTEMENTTTGGNHWGWPFIYIPWLVVATAPWSPLVVLALYDGIRKWRIEQPVRVVLIWIGAILIPLCINGNKQLHYLLTLMPPMMILMAWMISQWPMRWQKLIATVSVISIIGMSVVVNFVAPSRIKHNPRMTAAQIKALGGTSYVFYGPNFSLPLCFNLRSTIPSAADASELLRMSSPGTIVIAQTKNNAAPPPLPAEFVYLTRLEADEQTLDCYKFESK